MKFFKMLPVAVIAIAAMFSCKKENTANTDEEAVYAAHADDDQLFFQSVDDVVDESLDAVDDEPLLAGKSASVGPCNATKTFDSVNKRITIVYSGNNCLNTYSRFGKIIISLSPTKKWKDAGAVISIQTDSLKVTRLSTGKSIVISGIHTVTNLSGGRPAFVKIPASGYQQVNYLIGSAVTVRFDDGTARTWNADRKRTYSVDSNNKWIISITGNKTMGGQTNVAAWGTNRNGDAFTTTIVAPKTIKEACGFRLTSGKVAHRINNWVVTVTFGLDAAGNAVECPAGDFYRKVAITRPNGTVWEAIKPY